MTYASWDYIRACNTKTTQTTTTKWIVFPYSCFLLLQCFAALPVIVSCIFLNYFAEDKSNDETSKIVKLLNAMPDDDISVIHSILAAKCYVSFDKPQFGESHERRVNETTRCFTLPISEISAFISCSVSGTHKFDFLGIIRSLDLEIY